MQGHILGGVARTPRTPPWITKLIWLSVSTLDFLHIKSKPNRKQREESNHHSHIATATGIYVKLLIELTVFSNAHERNDLESAVQSSLLSFFSSNLITAHSWTQLFLLSWTILSLGYDTQQTLNTPNLHPDCEAHFRHADHQLQQWRCLHRSEQHTQGSTGPNTRCWWPCKSPGHAVLRVPPPRRCL